MRPAIAVAALMIGCGGAQRAAPPVVAEPPVPAPTAAPDVDRGTFVHFVDGVEVGTEDFSLEPTANGWRIIDEVELTSGAGHIELETDADLRPVGGAGSMSNTKAGTRGTVTLALNPDGMLVVSVTPNQGPGYDIVSTRRIDLHLVGRLATFFVPVCRRDPLLGETLYTFPGEAVVVDPGVTLDLGDSARSLMTRIVHYRSGKTVLIACEGRNLAGSRIDSDVIVRRGDVSLAAALATAK